MSLRILFFARIKEQLDCAELILEWSDDRATLDQLHEFLCARNSNQWREYLSEPNIIRAVNQTVSNGNSVLREGDEIAFFPPVTGG